jgi:hypothetical protein
MHFFWDDSGETVCPEKESADCADLRRFFLPADSPFQSARICEICGCLLLSQQLVREHAQAINRRGFNARGDSFSGKRVRRLRRFTQIFYRPIPPFQSAKICEICGCLLLSQQLVGEHAQAINRRGFNARGDSFSGKRVRRLRRFTQIFLPADSTISICENLRNLRMSPSFTAAHRRARSGNRSPRFRRAE